ncbi:LAME_0C05974g1_1 [Lachancea meyersii CBS 8951]|uniref:Ubiquitin carboxyl-terminal hydrolase n=1 Tax=Lachancea meyersii CBS 8951 TaxID=1266667 RepID=A0A1G4J253_9SACH|nr:LAME_0C05974g1_1 [Lachancea meyersii CBS 8951]
MPLSKTTGRTCKSVAQLIKIADQFVQQDAGKNQDMEMLLQECIDTLVNYQEECKKLRKWGSQHLPQNTEVFEAYEAAYVYYKIVSQLVLNKIPELPEFVHAKNKAETEREKGLIELYNMLVKTLLTDEKFAEIRKFIKDHSLPETTGAKKSGTRDQSKLPPTSTWTNGQSVTAWGLATLLQTHKVLIIDLRPRIKFIESHIKSDTIMCIEPISFKDTYSDIELSRRSLITSPSQEVNLFKQRDTFDYIVVCTDENDKTQFSQQKQASLVELLVERSFEKPLGDTKVLALEGGLRAWVESEGLCETSCNIEDHEYAMEYSIPPLKPQKPQLMKPAPSSSSYAPNFDDNGLATPNVQLNSSLLFPDQRSSVLKRSSSFKDRMTSLSPISRTNSPSLQPNSITPRDSTTYPETPQLVPSATQTKLLSQLKPFETRSFTPLSRSLSPPRLNGSFAEIDLKNGVTRSKALKIGNGHGPGNSEEHVVHAPSTKQVSRFCVGLVNLGNSCYMNCIIQCLLGTYELCQIFLDESYKNHINLNSRLGSKGVLAKYFSQLIHLMRQKALSASATGKKMLVNGDEKNAVQPIHFKVASGSINPLFKGSSQQDCQEFCQFLLDGLHEDLNQCGGNPALKELSEEAEKIREKLCLRIASSIEWERYLTTDFSVIVDLFQGQYASQLKCKVCGRTSTTYQPFSVLSVPVPRGSRCDIIDCFKEFTKIETLEKDEQWFCPQCKIKQPSTKKITITRLPRNLIIHLKRFDNLLHKNNIFISYPHTLDLTQFWADDFDGKLPPGVSELPTRGQTPPFNYNLYAVACHFGSLYGGHYTSYVNKGSPNGWCYFDDTSWRRAKSDLECITTSAYVLFYHRTPTSSL